MKVAVAGSHTHAVYVAQDTAADGRVRLAHAPGPSLNLHCLPLSALAKNLRTGLANLRAMVAAEWNTPDFTPADRLVVSLPGVSSVRDRKNGRRMVERAGWPTAEGRANFTVVDDTYAGLVAGAHSTRGVCAFAGTGASVYIGTPDGSPRPFEAAFGKPWKQDGFGPMIGDHGSAFRLAMRTLEVIARDIDEGWEDADGPPAPPLFYDILNALGTEFATLSLRGLQNGFDELMANRNPQWRFTIAELAKVVTRRAEQGDAYARGRVTEAAQAIARTIANVRRVDPEMEHAPVYCQGGMFRHSPFYLAEVRRVLSQAHGVRGRVELARHRPVVGALLLATSPSWDVPAATAARPLTAAIEASAGELRAVLFNAPDAGGRA